MHPLHDLPYGDFLLLFGKDRRLTVSVLRSIAAKTRVVAAFDFIENGIAGEKRKETASYFFPVQYAVGRSRKEKRPQAACGKVGIGIRGEEHHARNTVVLRGVIRRHHTAERMSADNPGFDLRMRADHSFCAPLLNTARSNGIFTITERTPPSASPCASCA